MLDDQRKDFEDQLNGLKREHEKELDDEKQATRLALEAVRRVHEEELRSVLEKSKGEEKDRHETNRQSKMLEQMREEITSLSALYSSKCVENAQLDELLSAADHSAKAELQQQVDSREKQLDEHRKRITTLERRLADLSGKFREERERKTETQRHKRHRHKETLVLSTDYSQEKILIQVSSIRSMCTHFLPLA